MLQDNGNNKDVEVGIVVEEQDSQEKIEKLAVEVDFTVWLNSYVKKRQWKRAHQFLEDCKDQGLDPAAYWTFKAGLHAERGEIDQQAHCVKKAIRFCENDLGNKAGLYAQLSWLKFRQKDKRQAKYYARRALKIFKEGVQPYTKDLQLALQIAYRLNDAGLSQEAVNLLEPIFESNPKDSVLRNALAYSYYYNKNYEQVLEITKGLLYTKTPDYNHIVTESCKALGLKHREIRQRADMQFFYDCEVRDFYTDYASQTPHQSPITVNGMTVDLKQMDDGSIRILELNYLPASGLNAYGHLYKRSLPDIINEDYRRFNNDFFKGNDWVEKQYPFLRYQFTGMGVPQFLTNMVLQTFYDDPIMVNASLNALTAQSYKDDFILNCQNLGLHGFIPPSLVVAKDQSAESTQNRISKMNGDCFVLKTSNDARGEGVEIVSRSQLNKAIDHIVTGQKWAGFTNPDTWKNDYHPNFVIQECVQSKPCRASDGENYDGTMRVALTHVFNHETDTDCILFHDMFWKLPRDPISQKHGRNTIMSLAHNERVKLGRPFAARVQRKRQQMVRGHLVDFFDKFGPYMAQHNDDVIHHKIEVAQSNRRDTMSKLVREQLTSHPYGDTIPIMSNHIPEAVRFFDEAAERYDPHEVQENIINPFRQYSRASSFRP